MFHFLPVLDIVAAGGKVMIGRVSQHMKYVIDMNAPLPIGAPIDKLEEE